MDTKLFSSELKVMNVLWKEGDIPAKQIIKILGGEVGWKKSTTYTIIKRCIDKGLIENKGGEFICHALISKDEAQKYETTELINNMYDGAADRLVASVLGREGLTPEEIGKLKKMIDDLK